MFSPVIAQQLRERGHDVIAVAADPRLRALDDAERLQVGPLERPAAGDRERQGFQAAAQW